MTDRVVHTLVTIHTHVYGLPDDRVMYGSEYDPYIQGGYLVITEPGPGIHDHRLVFIALDNMDTKITAEYRHDGWHRVEGGWAPNESQ